MKRRNQYAMALRSPLFRKQVVADRRKKQAKVACRKDKQCRKEELR